LVVLLRTLVDSKMVWAQEVHWVAAVDKVWEGMVMQGCPTDTGA